jgi:hypothetical protein
MHLRKSWLVMGALAAVAVQAATIYKWTDADGVVHYSDQPVPDAEKVYTSSAPTPASRGAGPARANPAGSAPKKTSAALDYASFAISSPKPDETFFGDNQVSVHLNLEPGLKANQTITWHLNGKQLEDQADNTSFLLPRLDRGNYAIAATITDQQTGESQSTDSVSFFVRQPSELAPQHK